MEFGIIFHPALPLRDAATIQGYRDYTGIPTENNAGIVFPSRMPKVWPKVGTTSDMPAQGCGARQNAKNGATLFSCVSTFDPR